MRFIILTLMILFCVGLVSAEFKTEDIQDLDGLTFKTYSNCEDQTVCYLHHYNIGTNPREIDMRSSGFWCSTEKSLVQEYCPPHTTISFSYSNKTEEDSLTPTFEYYNNEGKHVECDGEHNYNQVTNQYDVKYWTSTCLHNETITMPSGIEYHSLWCDEDCTDPYCTQHSDCPLERPLKRISLGGEQWLCCKTEPTPTTPKKYSDCKFYNPTRTKCELETERINNLSPEQVCEEKGYRLVLVWEYQEQMCSSGDKDVYIEVIRKELIKEVCG